MRLAIAALALAMLGTAPSFAAEPGPDLPAICLANAKADPMGGMAMSAPAAPAADAAHAELMAGMGAMDTDMMAGGTATDIDVAFACSMIPHHRGAIAMAKAVLAHGDDPWIKELATGVITAQEKEVAQMLEWLAKQ